MSRICKKALTLAVTAAVAAMGNAPIAAAQEQTSLEEVYVTGSRIARDGFEYASPVDVFTAEDIAQSGATTIDQFLARIPAFSGFQLGAGTNNGNTGTGSKMVNLRGLGEKRTLVLINGKRQVGSFVGDSSDIGAVDLNAIPASMVERIEVLKDGASTAYGTDAIAGVVNLILKQDFEGVEISGEMGYNADEWDGKNEQVALVAGATNDRGGVTFGLEYNKQDEVKQGDRDFSKDALWPVLQEDGSFQAMAQGSSNSRRIRTSSFSDAATALLPDGATQFIVDEETGEVRPFEGGDTYNYAPVNALITPTERWHISALGDQEIFSFTDGSVRIYGEGMYTNRKTSQRLAPDASFAVTPDFEGNWNDHVPASNPFNPFGDNADNPYGISGEDVRINRRFEESGGRLFSQDGDTFRMVTGFDGDYKGVNWDLSYVYAEDEVVTETNNYGRFDRWAIAVDPERCAADAACAAATGPENALNPFGPFGSISPEEMSYLSAGSLKDVYKNRLTALSLDLDGAFGELPGGAVGWAAGYQTRSESADFIPDEFTAGGLTTSGAQDPLSASFRVDEYYAEVLLPVLADVPLVQMLEVEASVRYSDYNTDAGSTDNYRGGINWTLNDAWRVRSVYSTGFRAPNIVELVGGQTTTFPIVEFPCEFADRRSDINDATRANCAAAGVPEDLELGFQWQSAYTQEAATDLEPEESESFTFGVVWSPEFAQGLRTSVDYWSFEVDDVIGLPDFNGLIRNCLAAEDQASEFACSFFAGGTGVFPDDVVPDDATAGLANLGKLETSGIDYSVDYLRDVDWGVINTFQTTLSGTYTDEYKETFPGSGTRDLVGTAGANDGFDIYAENRINLRLGISGEAWSAAWTMRWIDEAEDLLRPAEITDDAKAEDVLYHDIFASYSFRNVVWSVGVDNLTDEEPPRFHSAFNANTAPGTYDTFGIRAYTRVKITF